jgi:hypothetical protein
MLNFVRNQIGKSFAVWASVLAWIAVWIVGDGMVDIRLRARPTNVDWDCILGAFFVFLFAFVFWFITP